MQAPALDFGLFIAYIIPGVIALYALSLVMPKLRDVFDDGKPGVGRTVLLTLLALAAGRIISIGRAAIIDTTFQAPLPLLSCSRAPHRGSVPSVEPDYLQLTKPGYREAFVLAVGNEQRPYQFCGNTALAALLFAVCWFISLPGVERRRARVVAAVVVIVVLAVVLYFGARQSHYRFMRAIAALNDKPLQSTDGVGRPCMAAAP